MITVKTKPEKTTILGNAPQDNMQEILTFPVDNSIGPNGFLRTEGAINSDKQLYPLVSGLPKDQTDAAIDSGIVGPMLSATEVETYKKKQQVYEEVFTTSALDNRPPEEAIAELEAMREENPLLKQFISPATLAMLKQSDNPTARKMATDRVTNVFIAANIIGAKMEEKSKESFATFHDFLEVMASDLPGVSIVNVVRRKEIANRFVQLLGSNESPDIVASELQSIVDEAADMGFFTDNNGFYLNDFLALVMEGTTGDAAAWQETFSAIDIIPAIGFAIGASGDVGKLVAFARKSPKEVKAIVEDAIKLDNPVTGHTNPAGYGPSITDPLRTPVLPAERVAMLDIGLESNAWKAAVDARIASGKAIDGPEWEAFSTAVEADYKARAKASGIKSYIDADVQMDEFENVYLLETYGTKKGTPYKRKVDAEKVAADMMGEVIPAPDGVGFLIRKRTNIPTGEFSMGTNPVKIAEDLRAFKTTNPDELANRNFYTRWLGSPTLQTTPLNHALLVRGEAARSMAGFTVFQDFNSALKAAGKEGSEAVGRVVEDIRDGALANVRPWLTMSEFEGRFLELNKRLPSEAEKRVYATTVELDDVNWAISADFHFKREVNKGIEVFNINDLDVTGVKIPNSEKLIGRQAWDTDKGKYVDISSLDESYSIIRLTDPMEFGKEITEFVVTKNPRSRALKHSDVLGRNAGGPRLYTPNKTNFIVKQAQETKLVDGKVFEGRPTAILVAKTEKEANKAVSEINNIISAIHSAIPVKSLTKFAYTQLIKGRAADEALNAAVFANNGFNKQITNISEFIEHWEAMGLDIRKTVDHVGDGEPLTRNNDLLSDLFWKDSLTAPGNLKRGHVRRDEVLVGYGGTKLDTVSPFESVYRATMNTMSRATNAAYEAAAINGLLKKLLIGENGKSLISKQAIEEIRFLPLRQKIKALEGKIMTSTKAGKKLELERLKTVERLNGQNHLDKWYHTARETLGNILYDKGWTKASKFIDARSADPVAGARGIVFDSYLGMFAADQFYVQGQQAFAVMAIAEHFDGVKAASAYPYIRKMIMNGHMAPIEEVSKYLGPILGITPKETADIANSFLRSGRWSVQASLSDLGEEAAGKVVFNKIRHAGRFFYKEGELVSRITAHTAASLEFIKKFPGKSLLSEEGRNYVARRADIMTASMTSASRGPLEHLPFMQFMSYQMRMGEQLFAGLFYGKKVLDNGTKLKLISYQAAFYGASSLPFIGKYMDDYEYKYGEPMNPEVWRYLREGMFDAIMSEVTGVETEFGRRVAWGEGIFSRIQNTMDGNVLAALAGPTGTFSGTLTDAITKLVMDIKLGGGTLLAQDTLDVARSIKSVNMLYNAIVAWKHEEYRLRNGVTLRDDMNSKEAFALAMGIPLEKVNQYWRDIKNMRSDTDYYRDRANTVSRLWTEHLREIKANGDSERARKIQAAIAEVYRIESPYGRMQIDRFTDKNALTENEELYLQLMKTDAARGKEYK